MNPLALLSEYLGGGGYIQITPNTQMSISVAGKTLNFKELWGRVSIASGVNRAIFVFDDLKPKPTFSTSVLGITVNVTINGLEITDEEIVAVTSLGRHSIWSSKTGASS